MFIFYVDVQKGTAINSRELNERYSSAAVAGGRQAVPGGRSGVRPFASQGENQFIVSIGGGNLAGNASPHD